MDFTKIIVVSGKSGIFKVISQSRVGYIAESLIDNKKMPISPSNRITSIEDIVVFTEEEEIKLKDVLKKIKEHTKGKQAIDHKKDEKEVKEFFETVLPNYDKERVYFSDIKKIIFWYNLLQKNNMIDFEEEEENKPKEKSTTEKPKTTQKNTNQKPVVKKTSEKKVTAKKTIPQKSAKKV